MASGISQPKNLSPELEAVVGAGPMGRDVVIKLLWEYIKGNNLQDPNDRRMIVPDDKLQAVFGTNEPVHMMQMSKLLSAHLS